MPANLAVRNFCMKWMIMALVAALQFAWPIEEAAAQKKRFDVRECRDQAQAFARLDINCVLTVRASERDLASAPAYLQALLGDLECRVPLQFDKAKVYGVWITENRVNPPPLNVNCSILSGVSTGDITAVFDIDCVQSQNTWSCYPGLSNVRGLGPLAPVIEDFVNDEPILSRFLAKQLAKFD